MDITPEMARQVQQAASATTTLTTGAYPEAVILGTLSFMVMLLIIPPMFWHFRNRNIGATVLVAWVVILLLFTFINTLLWPNDDIKQWYNGEGLCDVEVKIWAASQVALPSSFACILRALAAVLNTNRVTTIQTTAQRRRTYLIDLIWCIGSPCLQMFFDYVVSPYRYYIFGIAGCVPAASYNWVTFLLIIIVPVLWVVVDTYYAVLILIRLYRYRLTFNSILASSNTNKSRFIRLYAICILWILCTLPTSAYIISVNAHSLQGSGSYQAYSWSEIHNPKTYNRIIMVPSGGRVVYDHWIPLAVGIVVFVFFGFGRDAVNMYRSGLLAVGLGKIIPSLDTDSRGSTIGTISSFSSKARMLFKRKSDLATSTWTTESDAMRSNSEASPVPPRNMTFLDTIDESSSRDEKSSNEVVSHPIKTGRTPLTTRIMSTFRTNKVGPPASQQPLPMVSLTGEQNTVQSAITSGPRSPSLAQHARNTSSNDVLVRKEIRQGSEHDETLPRLTFEAV